MAENLCGGKKSGSEEVREVKKKNCTGYYTQVFDGRERTWSRNGRRGNRVGRSEEICGEGRRRRERERGREGEGKGEVKEANWGGVATKPL